MTSIGENVSRRQSDEVVNEKENDAPAITQENDNGQSKEEWSDGNSFVRSGLQEEIAKGVVRKKLAKMRHLVLKEAIDPSYLDSLFPSLLKLFNPQEVTYNGGIAGVKDWKISCYLEVMEGGIPTTNPNTELLNLFHPLLNECNNLFLYWYRQKSACNKPSYSNSKKELKCKRLMTFITRYTPAPGEQALLKHVDGAGKVDGSVVVALPIDRWSAPERVNSFVGHGGVSTGQYGSSIHCINNLGRRFELICCCCCRVLTHCVELTLVL